MNFKNSPLIIVAVLAVALIISISSINGARSGLWGNSIQGKEFTVRNGAPFSEIADNLEQGGFIRSKTLFRFYSFMAGDINGFKAGNYSISPSMSLSEIARLLAVGPKEISVIIIPGTTLKEIDDKLSGQLVVSAGALSGFDINSVKGFYPWLGSARSLEGFLLPDTYYFSQNSDIKTVIRKILDNFEKKALPFFGDNPKDAYNKLILASILEKEIPDYAEQRIGAGILEKRMEAGMALQVDSSIIYAKCSGRFSGCPQLVPIDYKISSPYNTYLQAGLPPTPICNPSPKTIDSAVRAEKSDYWYYLSDPKTQKTIFSKTLDEHNDNRALYLLKK